jgi:competence protein ComEC
MSSLFIKIWDVQHGLAIYVRTPNGKHIVIDLGLGDTSGNTGNWKDFSPLRHLKYNYKITQLDELIITHPHTDHIDDIDNLGLLPPISLLAPRLIPEADIRKGNRLGDSPKIDSYLALIRRYNISVPDSTNPQEAAYNGGVEIQHFIPTLETSNLNDRSIVVFLTYANSTICIPGDNEKASWKELLLKPTFRQ